MEILKRIFILILAIGTQLLNAQNQKAIQVAFYKSYDFEYEKKYTKAIEVLKSLNYSENYPLQLRLGWLQYCAKKYDESILSYKKAAELMPASIEPLLGLVNPLIVEKKWGELEQNYLKILKKDSKNSIINFRLGQIYYHRKEYTKAANYFSVSLNLHPFDYDAMLMSGWNYYFLGRYSEAKELFNRVLLLSPEDASAREGLGLIK